MKNAGRLVLLTLRRSGARRAAHRLGRRTFGRPYVAGPSFFAPDSEGVITTGPRLVVTQLGSAPATARPGRSYLLRGVVANSGIKAVRGAVTVHLLRVGSHPLVIGATPVRLRAGRSAGYAVRITIPRGLHNGSYCARRLLAAQRLERCARLRDRRAAPADRAACRSCASPRQRRRPPTARRARIRSRTSATTSTRRRVTAATRASTPTSSWSTTRRRTCSCRATTSISPTRRRSASPTSASTSSGRRRRTPRSART